MRAESGALWHASSEKAQAAASSSLKEGKVTVLSAKFLKWLKLLEVGLCGSFAVLTLCLRSTRLAGSFCVSASFFLLLDGQLQFLTGSVPEFNILQIQVWIILHGNCLVSLKIRDLLPAWCSYSLTFVPYSSLLQHLLALANGCLYTYPFSICQNGYFGFVSS